MIVYQSITSKILLSFTYTLIVVIEISKSRSNQLDLI
jgi:hypothetical protein